MTGLVEGVRNCRRTRISWTDNIIAWTGQACIVYCIVGLYIDAQDYKPHHPIYSKYCGENEAYIPQKSDSLPSITSDKGHLLAITHLHTANHREATTAK